MRPETVVETPKVDVSKVCKKCGHNIIEELKPAKKGKGMFCIDVNACKKRASKK
jgi:lysyl-tRNA synthetase class 2